MRYRDLKDERDAAVARALEAERLSMKSEFDRVTAEFEAERKRLVEQAALDMKSSYELGFRDGVDAMAADITCRISYRGALKPTQRTVPPTLEELLTPLVGTAVAMFSAAPFPAPRCRHVPDTTEGVTCCALCGDKLSTEERATP